MNSPKTQQPEIAGVTSLELSRQPFGASAQCNISYLLYIISYYHLLSFCYQKNSSMHSMHTLLSFCLLCFPFCLPRSSLGDLIVLSRAWLPSIGHPVVSYRRTMNWRGWHSGLHLVLLPFQCHADIVWNSQAFWATEPTASLGFECQDGQLLWGVAAGAHHAILETNCLSLRSFRRSV